jgi:predicted RNA-binding Zn-ribbon protein involved in translation (DUF1610 family)
MAKTKKQQPAKPPEKCPACGLTTTDSDPATYTCPECGKEGFDCCIAGNGVMCFECEEVEAEDAEDDDAEDNEDE